MSPKWPCKHLLPSPLSDDVCTLHGRRDTGAGTFGTWHVPPSISMGDSVSCLRYAECSRAPDYITYGHGYPMQTIAAHGLRSCPSVRTQPLTATGAPSQTSAMPCHAPPPAPKTIRNQSEPNPHVGRCLTSEEKNLDRHILSGGRAVVQALGSAGKLD